MCGGEDMAKRKYSEVEMIGALKQMEAGRSAAEVGRELGVSKHTVYAWKAKYGGMTGGGAQRLRQLEDEKGRVKKTGGARRTQGGSALAVEQVSGEPAADLRAVERGGVEPAVCEPEERRRGARELDAAGGGVEGGDNRQPAPQQPGFPTAAGVRGSHWGAQGAVGDRSAAMRRTERG